MSIPSLSKNSLNWLTPYLNESETDTIISTYKRASELIQEESLKSEQLINKLTYLYSFLSGELAAQSFYQIPLIEPSIQSDITIASKEDGRILAKEMIHSILNRILREVNEIIDA